MSREMTNSEAIANLNHIYGMVSPNIQRSLDLAIKALEQKTKDCSDCKRYDSPYFEIKIDKEQMQELVDKAKAELLASIEQGEWVPVSERLPEQANKSYLVTLEYKEHGKGVTTLWYHGKEIGWDLRVADVVTAWQPLPEPYKGGGEE